MSILNEINENKLRELEIAKSNISINDLQKSPFFKRNCNSIKAALLADGASGIIAEFKRSSPSKGVINNEVDPCQVVAGYIDAGASAISVLTDSKYFGGSFLDLAKARFANDHIPVLRKDFMLDEYQIYEAKAHGADVILLIAESLTKDKIANMTNIAHEIGLEVLLELHNQEEIDKIPANIDLVGINNRNLRTFEVDVETSAKLAAKLPADIVYISESGLSDAESIRYLRKHGFSGFLMGENFMKTKYPAATCQEFIEQI